MDALYGSKCVIISCLDLTSEFYQDVEAENCKTKTSLQLVLRGFYEFICIPFELIMLKLYCRFIVCFCGKPYSGDFTTNFPMVVHMTMCCTLTFRH